MRDCIMLAMLALCNHEYTNHYSRRPRAGPQRIGQPRSGAGQVDAGIPARGAGTNRVASLHRSVAGASPKATEHLDLARYYRSDSQGARRGPPLSAVVDSSVL